MELQKINLNLDSSIRRTVSYLIGYQHSSKYCLSSSTEESDTRESVSK